MEGPTSHLALKSQALETLRDMGPSRKSRYDEGPVKLLILQYYDFGSKFPVTLVITVVYGSEICWFRA